MRKVIMSIGVIAALIGFCLIPQALDGIHIRVSIVPMILVIASGAALIVLSAVIKRYRVETEINKLLREKRHREDADKQKLSKEMSELYQALILNEIWQ